MSLFRLPKLQAVTSRLERLGERFSRRGRRGASSVSCRRLTVDSLEARVLLSITPGNVDDVLINQTFSDSQFTIAGQSAAVDHDGDFVVTWTRYDDVLDGNGDPIIDNTTGLPISDANIYARYFTDEVQRITLPSELAEDNLAGAFGEFSVRVGGNEVQKLEITPTYQPAQPMAQYPFIQDSLAGTFTLGFDVDGSGDIGGTETTTIVYTEVPLLGFFGTAQHVLDTASMIQTQLQGLGGDLNDVIVEPISPQEFMIYFGPTSAGRDVPEIVVQNPVFTSGFYPDVSISTIREPVTIENIPLSPDNPELTAYAIEQYFLYQFSTDFFIGPVLTRGLMTPGSMQSGYPANFGPDTIRMGTPEVSVVPVTTPSDPEGKTTFDVTFVGDSGKKDQPEMVVTAVADDMGNTTDGQGNPLLSFAAVKTLKEPSPEFRVNPEEPENPFTPQVDKLNQTVPAVAMDADGDFVIVWQSEVTNLDDFGSVSDIFARRFSARGIVANPWVDANGKAVQGVEALVQSLAEDVQVITFDATGSGPLTGSFRLQLDGKTTASIPFNSGNLDNVKTQIRKALQALDKDLLDVKVTRLSATDPYRFEVRFAGNSAGVDYPLIQYVADATQPLAATVSVADASGDLLTFRVNSFTPEAQINPAVGMDYDGNFVVAWENNGQDISFFNGVIAQQFNQAGDRLGTEFLVNESDTNEHIDPAVALSYDGHILVTWTETWPTLNAAAGRAKVYDPQAEVLLAEFPVNAACLETVGAWDLGNNFLIAWWHGDQGDLDQDNIGANSSGVRARMYQLYDADGDLSGAVIRDTFRANSPTISDPQGSPQSATRWPFMQEGPQAALDADGDVVITFSGHGADIEQTPAWGFGFSANADLDSVLDENLFTAYNMGATAEQIAQLRKQYDDLEGLMRGDANGIMFSAWDAEPLSDQMSVTESDGLINAHRDGHNSRHTIELDRRTESGTFTVRVGNAAGVTEDITINPVYTNVPLINPVDTRGAIEDALRNATVTGQWWPYGNGNFYGDDQRGPVAVRLIPAFEVLSRAGTDWELDVVDPTNCIYEVTFLGELHDTYVGIGLAPGGNGLQIASNPAPAPVIDILMESDEGLIQEQASMGMEPDGDFTTVWTQHERFTEDFGFSLYMPANSNIYYRRIDETSDTAGPRVTELVDPVGNRLMADGFVEGPTQYMVLTFDEAMMTGDPLANPDSVLNPDNYVLYLGGVEIVGGVAHVDFGMNKAAELAGTSVVVEDLDGTFHTFQYELSDVPTNKWEAVLVLDANGRLMSGFPALKRGDYIVEALAPDPGTALGQAHSGLRDKEGNPLGYSGFAPAGLNMTRSFVVTLDEPDLPVSQLVSPISYINGTTHPETPGAVAVDGDGDYVAVWTGYDLNLSRDRVYMRMFDADGSLADLPWLDSNGNYVLDGQGRIRVVPNAAPVQAVTAPADYPGFQTHVQRHGNVAMDKDGDFVVTWTDYDAGDADVFARRFESLGGLKGVVPLTDGAGKVVFDANGNAVVLKVFANPAAVAECGGPFQANTYTANDQKWSDVAMDVDGDFVVTWSSYGQEDGGQMGSGYGIYARQYDSCGQPLAGEFMVNVTTGGNQQSSSVAMGSQGNFVIVWTSDQNGIGDDIIAREFNADGSPMPYMDPNGNIFQGPMWGEILVNDEMDGNQRNPDVSMSLDGLTYVITWSDSARDLSGYSVWAEMSLARPRRFIDPFAHPIFDSHEFVITVPDAIIIDDLNVQITALTHGRLEDLRVSLRSPSGTEIILFEDLPRPYPDGSRPPGNALIGTIFDDEAPTTLSITDTDLGAVPPYGGSFVPQMTLDAFDGENAQGDWTLVVWDRQNNGLVGYMEAPAPDGSWWLDIFSTAFRPNSFRVSTTREGNQIFSSVAMDHAGGFTVAWCGNGDQLYQEDRSGYGVFYQKFNEAGAQIGSETRVNSNVAGNQWLPSIANDGEGNFVVVWTGVGSIPGTTEVYRFTSVNDVPKTDNNGPLVTDVLFNGKRVLEGDVLDPSGAGVTQLTVAFDESISTRQIDSDGDGDVDLPGLDSVLNPVNWVLERNGSEIPGVVSGVKFSLNPVTRKYEAVLTLDGNGVNGGTMPLPVGDYVLTVRDTIHDVSIFIDPEAEEGEELVSGNPLDGDFDGVPGSEPITLGFGGYRHHFTVATGPQLGAEYRINPDGTRQYEQRFSEAGGTGYAREETTRSVAVDNDGDYVVVWTSYGQDNPSDPTGAGVYMAMFDRNDNLLSPNPENLVNTTTTGDQRNAAVAMDADGEFVVVWESEGQDPDGSWGVYGQRFDSLGRPVDGEFRVNSNTTGNQLNPAVGMDDYGNFVVVWATAGQDFSFFNDIYGQRYNWRGEEVGLEFMVNAASIPGTAPSGFEINPAVVMSDLGGDFVVAWDQVVAQLNGVITDTNIMVRIFGSTGAPAAAEFRADTGVGTGGGDTQRVARNPQLTMNDQGDFVVVWESFADDDTGDGVADSYGVYYQRFSLTGGTVASGQANQAQFIGHQVNPSVAMDADGEFAVVWNGAGGQPHPLDPANPNLITNQDTEGIFIRRYHAASAPVAVQSRVNLTETGIQQFPTIAMEPDGDIIVVWSGRGVGDSHGIFARRYDETADTAGPLATELRETGGRLVADGESIFFNPTGLVVVFDEQMSVAGGITGDHSVLNPNNWALVRDDGTEIQGAILSINFGLNLLSNKWEAIVTFDGNGAAGGSGPAGLPNGTYTLIARTAIQDMVGNPLARTGFRPAGMGQLPGGGTPTNPVTSPTGGFGFRFRVHEMSPGDPNPGDIDALVNQIETSDQTNAAIARSANGDYVVIWVSLRTDPTTQQTTTDIMGRLFDAYSRPIDNEFVVHSITAGAQIEPDVAIDALGNFVVTWSGAGGVLGDDSGIFAQRFDSDGDAIGGQFRVNQYGQYIQDAPSIAMENNGDFVITWTSFGQLGLDNAIFGRRYTALGQPLGNEFQVNLATSNRQDDSDVAMDADGDFVVTWASYGHDGSAWGIYGQRFNSAGARVGSEFRVNQYTYSDQRDPAVAMDANGSFVVTWSSFLQDGSGSGIYAQRYNSAGVALGSEFLVNTLRTLNSQQWPDVAMDPAGNYVVTWTSFGHDDNPLDTVLLQDNGVFAHMYNADGSEYLDKVTSLPVGEFRVNAFTNGNQVDPAVSRDAQGHYVIVWTGLDTDGTGIYSRLLDPPVEDPGTTNPAPTTLTLFGTAGDDRFEFVGGATPGSWVVKVNDVLQAVPASIVEVSFDGLGGHDTVILTGTDADDTVELWPDHGTLVGGSYSVDVVHVESITVDGLGGDDEATLHDSEGDDSFVARRGTALLNGPAVANVVRGFETISVHATAGGRDVAKLYDSPADDEFVGARTYGKLSGGGFVVQADSFDGVHVYATAGGRDVAKVYDSAGDDLFYASPIEAALSGNGFLNRIKFFEVVHAYASAGGHDEAMLFDSQGPDHFFGSPVEAALWNSEFYNRAKFFDSVTAYGTIGSGDAAVMHDSLGDDRLVTTPNYGELSGDGFRNRVVGFDDISAKASEGLDLARMYDSPGNDQLVTTPTYAGLSGNGYVNRAVNFDRVDTYASAGGVDVAKMYDSAGNDRFYASPIEGAMSGDGFFNRAKYFDGLHAFATAGGIDEANLFDSGAADTFVGTAESGAMFGTGFYNRAKFFETVRAHATGGVDKAYLYDAVMETQLPDANVAWLHEFDQCFSDSKSSDDGPVEIQAVDSIFAVYWP